MAVYAIGDVQGCTASLRRLLDKLRFDPAADTVWFCGDVVNRGPDSLGTVRLVRELGDRAVTVLGNHDLHFLSVFSNPRRIRRADTFRDLLWAPDVGEIFDWFRHRPLVHCDPELRALMVHAGVYPGWRRRDLVARAAEVEQVLRGKKYRKLLVRMYGRSPRLWQDDLEGWDRLRFIINACTRMRFCDRRGRTNLSQKGPPGSQSARYLPWFEHPDLRCRKWRIVFGHWASLGYRQQDNLVSLDSGCVWGGRLTAVRLDAGVPGPRTRVRCRADG